MRRISVASALLWMSTSAWALQNYTPTDLSTLDDAAVKALIQTIAIGAGHRAYAPATPLGVAGLDIGLEVTAVQLPNTFRNALTAAGVPNVPLWIAIPRINVHKGLPGNVDIGLSYMGYEGNQLYGGDTQWNFLKANGNIPSIAARVSASYLKLFFVQTHSYKTDLVFSRAVTPMLEPYVGSGMEFTNGDLRVDVSGPQGLSANVQGHQSGSAPHVFAGAPFKFSILHGTIEIDHSFAQSGITTYGAKISINF